MLLYIRNRFETATRTSFRKMVILITDHVSRLAAYYALYTEPFIQQLLNRTEPVKNDYVAYYTTWNTALGNYQSETLRFEQLIGELVSVKISQWGAQIKAVFPKNSPELKAILPDGYKPFQRGPYDIRISHVGGLATKLEEYPELSTLQAEVQAFHTDLVNTRDNQQQHELTAKNASVELHKRRKALAKLLHGNVGFLLNKFYETPEDIAQFFEVELISGSQKGDDTITVKLIFHTDQTTKKRVEVGVQLPVGKIIEIQWGDGLKQTITGNGSGVFVNHDYETEGIYKITIIGDISHLEELHTNESNLIYGSMKGLAFLQTFISQGNYFDKETVDSFLIAMDKSGIENGTFNLLGSASPSSKGLAAKARLEAKGWVVLVS